MKKFFKYTILALLAIFALLQLLQAKRTNPPVDPAKALSAPPAVAAILRESCYDCHSNETRWPWYAYVTPVSWWLVDHVDEGRQDMNLSEWAEYTTGEQQDFLANMAHLIKEGEMPLPSYLIAHRKAKLTPEQTKVFSEWANAEITKLDGPPPEAATAETATPPVPSA